jgi:DNA-binding NarL/FixJ family response regulator
VDEVLAECTPYIEMGSPWAMPLILDDRAVLARSHGDLAAGRALVDEAVAAALRSGSNYAAAAAALASARQSLAEGDLAKAESLAHDGLSSAEEAGARLLVLDALELLAEIAAAFESDIEAARLLGAAASAREALACPAPAVRLSRLEPLGSLVRARGGADGVAAYDAGRALSMSDAVVLVRRGRGARRRPSAGWAALTPTEVQVAALVAEGLTNPDIAARLFIARSTVKGHVSSVLSKLGMATRSELAAYVARRQTGE